jgi:hypothetical protein
MNFREAWFHETGFGTSNRMFSCLNVADPQEVITIALTEASPENAERLIGIDVAERGGSPLDDIVEPRMGRTFGILVAEDDFSATGQIPYRPASVGGRTTDLREVQAALLLGASLLGRISGEAGLAVAGSRHPRHLEIAGPPTPLLKALAR